MVVCLQVRMRVIVYEPNNSPKWIELRALQAQTFNDPESPVNVLVASDAIGMGLNLYVA